MNITEMKVLKVLYLNEEIRAQIQGETKIINFRACKIGGTTYTQEAFEKLLINHLDEIIETAKLIRWVQSKAYCEAHKITREGLHYRADQGLVRKRKLTHLVEYDLDTPQPPVEAGN